MTITKGFVISILSVGAISLLLSLPQFSDFRDTIINFLEMDYFVMQDVADSLRSPQFKPDKNGDGVRLFTADELSKYTGEAGSPGLYLSILGRVYDVSAGSKHYGPSGGYSFFAAKDGTRAFVTGEFNKAGLIQDVSKLSHQHILGIEDWKQFYDKDYKFMGLLVGHFYDSEGNPTKNLHKFYEDLKLARIEKDREADDHKMFPSCNSEWAQGKGGRVWCSHNSGGVGRTWTGVPRRYFKPGAKQYRCACVKQIGAPSSQPDSVNHKNVGDLDNPNFKLYDNCKPTAISCQIPDK